jgi:hypothetical protein
LRSCAPDLADKRGLMAGSILAGLGAVVLGTRLAMWGWNTAAVSGSSGRLHPFGLEIQSFIH